MTQETAREGFQKGCEVFPKDLEAFERNFTYSGLGWEYFEPFLALFGGHSGLFSDAYFRSLIGFLHGLCRAKIAPIWLTRPY